MKLTYEAPVAQIELLEIEDGVYNKLFTLQMEALKNAGITEQEKNMENNKTAVNKLSPENVTFRMENGFPALTYSENGQTTDYPRVFFHRNFQGLE